MSLIIWHSHPPHEWSLDRFPLGGEMPQEGSFTGQLQPANPLPPLPHLQNKLDDVFNSIIVRTGMMVTITNSSIAWRRQGTTCQELDQGFHASYLGPRFQGMDSTIAHYKGTNPLRGIAFLLRIKVTQKLGAVFPLRHPACLPWCWRRGDAGEVCCKPDGGSFLIPRREIMAMDKGQGNDQAIKRTWQETS